MLRTIPDGHICIISNELTDPIISMVYEYFYVNYFAVSLIVYYYVDFISFHKIHTANLAAVLLHGPYSMGTGISVRGGSTSLTGPIACSTFFVSELFSPKSYR